MLEIDTVNWCVPSVSSTSCPMDALLQRALAVPPCTMHLQVH